jgi:hypothetical protein
MQKRKRLVKRSRVCQLVLIRAPLLQGWRQAFALTPRTSGSGFRATGGNSDRQTGRLADRQRHTDWLCRCTRAVGAFTLVRAALRVLLMPRCKISTYCICRGALSIMHNAGARRKGTWALSPTWSWFNNCTYGPAATNSTPKARTRCWKINGARTDEIGGGARHFVQ